MKKTAIISAVLVVSAIANAAIVKEYKRVDGNKTAPLPGKVLKSDMFSDASLWNKPSSFRKAVSVKFAGGELVASGLKATNHYDTGWCVSTKPIALSTKGLGYAMSFEIEAKPRLTKTGGATQYICAVMWYDHAGKEIARDPFTLSSKLNARRREVLFGSVPLAAESFSLRFGFDRPDLLAGDSVTLGALSFSILEQETDPAWTPLPMPEAPRVKVVSESPFTNVTAALKVSVTSQCPLDWSSLKVKLDGKDATAAFRREGDILSYSPPAPWKPGLHHVEVTLTDPDEGQPFTAHKVFFCGTAPEGTPQVKLRRDGVTLVNGEPFFPIGLYGLRKLPVNGDNLENAVRAVAEGGFNTIHSYTEGRTKEFLDLAQKYGMKTWTSAKIPDRNFVNTLRNHPAVLAWYVGDDTAMHNTPSEIYDRVDGVRAVDSTRITVQADAMHSGDAVSSYRPFVKVTDGFLPEIYPVYKPTPVPYPQCVAHTIRDMKRFRYDVKESGDDAPHAIWPIIQYFRGWSSWKRFPTRDELFAMSFAALAHGAHGITFYTYGGVVNPAQNKDNHGASDTPETWCNMTNLAWRIRELVPALLAPMPPQPQPAKILSGPAADELGNESISVLVKYHGESYYVITVNGTCEKVTAELDLGIMGGEAEALWEGRKVAMDEGRLRDSFEPLAVHVYRIADPISYIAHQGEEALAPSHSKAAYRIAAAHRLDYLKLDVRETKDGHVVMQHDATLQAIMKWNVRVIDHTLAEIREKGRCRSKGGYHNERIVTLPEALEIANGMRKGVWIDFKYYTPAFAEKVFKQLAEAGYGPDRVIVATFTKAALRWVQKNHPEVRCVAHTFIRRLPEGGFQSNAGDEKKTYPTLEALGDALEAHARDYGLYGFNMPHIFRRGKMLYQTPPALVKRLRRAGYWISIWFAYTPPTAEYYRAVGVDAFVTNCKAHTFPANQTESASTARLMRLLAQIPDAVKDAAGDRADALFFCTWEPELAMAEIEKTGKTPCSPEEAFELLCAGGTWKETAERIKSIK